MYKTKIKENEKKMRRKNHIKSDFETCKYSKTSFKFEKKEG